jgi:hypothetical protein
MYLGCLTGGVVLLCLALATSYWRRNENEVNVGLFKTCARIPGGKVECYSTWHNAPTWRRAVGIMMFIALGISLFAFGWWMVACIGCCCQNCLAPPLPFLALLLALMTSISVIVYASMFPKEEQTHFTGNTYYGYSFWTAVASACAFGVTAFLGCGVMGTIHNDRSRTAYNEI